ncbi:helix-turn-helix domain-containing protein [Mucilaginibacter auburnensis]|uniref:Helix-turn-helix protein n=1 Tax=Mucilaginibacter auburnensis TaxID=1457233 RepID=A0A2H9VVX3_9SPHI|nr:AraC family transcriptional regulator [Mucilaginibacter auburnensis]PJJ84970.1 helix-turn-helix protein [Mucilaginibacter auburnensis]
MKITIGLSVILYLAAISLGLFFSLLLFFSHKNKTANRILGALTLAITGWIIDAFFRASDIYGQRPDLYFLPIYYSFSFGPLIYFYVQAITNKKFSLTKKNLLHFIPVFIQALFYWVVTFKSYNGKYIVWENIHRPYTYRVEYDGTWLSLVIYLSLSILYLKKYRLWLNDNYSNLSKKMLNWLKTALLILVTVCVTWFFEAYLRDFENTYYRYDFSTNLLCLVIYCIGIVGMQQSSTNITFEPSPSKVEVTSALLIDQAIMEKINFVMVNDKLYLNADLTLADLALYLKLPTKTVSTTINIAFGKSFNSYVNSFRIEEVKQRFKTADLEKFTLLAIAYESGFNSKATFNRTFKEQTGKSPSDFIGN